MRSVLTSAAVLATALAGAALAAAPVHAAPAAPAAAASAAAPAEKPQASNGRPRDARITIPAIPRITDLPVIAYRGRTDDAPGTRIQNRGVAAAPYGPRGGTGPGGIGNYQVTGHRTSHGGIFRTTPDLGVGRRILVDVGRWRYVYEVRRTRWVSFRSERSLRQQRAEVPGRPGEKATRAYLTLSTCATPEDRARGNHWTDRFGNPEHRIDKIGVLVRRVQRP